MLMSFPRGSSLCFWIFLLGAATVGNPASAFHSGGTGECTGCHDMHKTQSSSEGMDNNVALLAGKDPGSVCLGCHLKTGQKQPDSYLVATADLDMPAGMPPVQLTPAGDFGWLKKSYRWGAGEGGGGGYSPGERHGHSIVADEYRFSLDTERITAPGGTYPSNSLSCISCHDPHGKYRRFAGGSIGTVGAPTWASGSYDSSPDPTGNQSVGVYRLLGGKGYKTFIYDGEPFTADPPSAVSPLIQPQGRRRRHAGSLWRRFLGVVHQLPSPVHVQRRCRREEPPCGRHHQTLAERNRKLLRLRGLGKSLGE